MESGARMDPDTTAAFLPKVPQSIELAQRQSSNAGEAEERNGWHRQPIQ